MGLTKLKMPQLGESVTEGTVERWLKAEGELVRRVAEKNGVELSQISATGAGGRLTRDDVIAHLSVRQTGAARNATAQPTPAAAAARSGAREELMPVSPVRRQIAEHMVRSLST